MEYYLCNPESYHFRVAGLSQSGKTAFIRYLQHGQFVQTQPTDQLELSRVFVHGVRCFFWDYRKFGSYELEPATLTASNILNELIPKSLQIKSHKIDAIIYLVDSADSGRLPLAKADFEKLLKTYHHVPTVLILATKSDEENSLSESYIRDLIIETAFDREFFVSAISLVNGGGVTEALDWLYSRVWRNRGCLNKIYKPFFTHFFPCC